MVAAEVAMVALLGRLLAGKTYVLAVFFASFWCGKVTIFPQLSFWPETVFLLPDFLAALCCVFVFFFLPCWVSIPACA